MKRVFSFIVAAVAFIACATPPALTPEMAATRRSLDPATEVMTGAQQPDRYVDLLRGKRVALFSNQTGIVGWDHTGKPVHTLDLMLFKGLKVTTIFSPEHGFRGTADAGEHVSSSVDPVTGIPIASLYDGKRTGPSPETMAAFDVLVVDIQDVGLRYYTYYVTMIKLMEACAAAGKDVVVLDRPNPNGMTVDGPVLDMRLRSGVGRLPIPTVHGMTLGEIALMANGEHWLKDNLQVKNLTVIPCKGYTHQTRYRLPVAPSPNLPNMTSIYLYPSTCYFEGTDVSLGRGTDKPFQQYGHPDMVGYSYSFTPRSVPGAKNPPQLDKLCHGVDLSGISDEEAIAMGVNLEYVVNAYRNLGQGEKFFTKFFDKLMGTEAVRKMIVAGMSPADIKATWSAEVDAFRAQRRPYLLYPE